MASSCLMWDIPRSIFDSVGFNHERGHNKRSVESEESTKSSSSSLPSSEEETFPQEMEDDISDLVLLLQLLLQLDYISLMLELWLRKINLTSDSVKRHELQNFKDTILTTEESVIKPYKEFLMSNQDKGIAELSSEEISMVQFYCQRLEEQWKTISKQKRKNKFEMTENDRVCSVLGLKLDFLEGMAQNTHDH